MRLRRTSSRRKSSPLVAASSTGFSHGLSGSRNEPMIEAKVTSACDSRPAKAVRACALRNGASAIFCRYGLSSVPSPEDRRSTWPSVGLGEPGRDSACSNRYRVKARNALRAWPVQNLSLSSPSG
ncbi:hypothetical protein D3C71_1626730 [compost metagenome]